MMLSKLFRLVSSSVQPTPAVATTQASSPGISEIIFITVCFFDRADLVLCSPSAQIYSLMCCLLFYSDSNFVYGVLYVYGMFDSFTWSKR
jgi:hypothetical protein